MRRQLQFGVHLGAGPAPGYLWNIVILGMVKDEAMGFLNEAQYAHMSEQVRDLAREQDPTHSDLQDVRPIEEFHELRDKGGVLGKINVRVFFCIDKKIKAIVVLGSIKKDNDGQTPLGDKVRMRRRMRLYFEGQYGEADVRRPG